jgi:exopolysaccharide production protein ExoQ
MSTTLAPIYMAPFTSHSMADDPLLFRRVRTWWTLVALFQIVQGGGLFTEQGHFQYLMKVIKQKTNDPSHTLLPLTLATVAICIGLMVGHIRPIVRLMLKQKAMLAFPILAFASTLWSQVPFITFRKAALMSLAFALAWFFATYYSPGDQTRVILAAGVIVALASTAMAILLPQYGISWAGEWKGVFSQKNHMGIGIFFLFAALPFCRISSRRRLLTLASQSILPIGLLLLSRSRTSWFLAIVLIAVRVLGPLITRTRREKIPFVLYSIAFGLAAVAVSLGVVLSLLGRDLTFSGRTREWAIIAPFALKHFWLGYGYQAFWVGNIGDSGTVEHLIGGQNVADNGYLDGMLQLGLVGVVILVIVLIACMRDFRRLLRGSSLPLLAYWYAALILATLVGSFSESLLWGASGQFNWFMLVLGCAGLRRLRESGQPPAAMRPGKALAEAGVYV